MHDVTRILRQIEDGEPSASEELLPLVYSELRRLAASRLAKEKPGQTLQATALVHDAFLRLVDAKDQQKWNSRGHFFGAAAEAMRRILVENARRKARLKRGGDLARQELNESEFAAPQVAAAEIKHDIIALDEALNALQKNEPEKYELVRLRFFAGLTNAQAAEALNISTSTADRYWAYARAWLYQKVAETGEKQ